MKVKRWISLWLLVLLSFSMMDASMLKVDAATNDTLYANKHLQNGNFEEAMGNYTFSSNYAQPNKTSVPYWDTTALGGKLEFFKSKSAHFDLTRSKYPSNPEYRNVAEDEVAAELNADEVSTIYQRVNTYAGSTYTWGLYHRGRKGTDRMVLFIGPEQKDANGNRVDPSKDPSVPEAERKNSPDQFVRITEWLKGQYGVDYPETGCSQKYIVYSKPFAANGKFEGEDGNDISLVKTEKINQEWSVWVISSPYCNTAEGNVNGWSKYGTNACNDFEDIMKGANSSLGYDCTYTVPNGQTQTLFAFCSYESSNGSKYDPTFGNLLDGINFDLYQPFSTSTTPGGQGNVDNISVTNNITSGNPLHTKVLDGQYCTIYTSAVTNGSITGCTFQGAYVTINNANGTSSTTFVPVYSGSYEEINKDEKAKEYFVAVDPASSSPQYYYKVSVGSQVSIHLIYEKAPFVLYDANGGADYYFSPDNTAGGNLVGFGKDFVKIFDKVVDGQDTYIDTSAYYKNYDATATVEENEAGFYISHAALPNANWDKNDDDTSPHRFCGWKVLDSAIPVVLDGEHRIEYKPTGNNADIGMITITDSNNTVNNLQLDASNGVTLSAIWKFANRAYSQTYVGESYKNSAVGGTVEETMISNDLRSTDVIESFESVSGVNRVSSIEAFGSAGDTIMFKATADYANNYKFVGWYKREKQGDTYTEVLKSTATSIAVTVEEGKLGIYYARFQKMDNPVVFHYSASGSADGYDYYDRSEENPRGKYFQNVVYGGTAVKPTGDSKSVQTWFTSPTKRSAECIFDFSTPITQETHLYAGPTFTYNYFTNFSMSEPWTIRTYATLKFGGNYIDLTSNSDVSDYNVYILKGTLGEAVPSPTAIKNNKNTIKVGKLVSSENNPLLTNTVTNTGATFNRIGTSYMDLHIFDMKTPVWVMFDFTYKDITYTSTVKDRSLYNNITTYMNKNDAFFTTLPQDIQSELYKAQTELLKKIQGLYDAGVSSGITAPTEYSDASAVTDLSYDPTTDNTYTFSSTTAIRNIEPWGLKYSFKVANQTVTDFADYGAVVLTDRTGKLKEVSVSDLLGNTNSVMYSYSAGNVYTDNNGAVEVYYVNDLHASDFDKPTYVVFFVKDTNGKYYFSPVVQNTYYDLAYNDQSAISQSIVTYSSALKDYLDLIKQAGTGQSTSPVA